MLQRNRYLKHTHTQTQKKNADPTNTFNSHSAKAGLLLIASLSNLSFLLFQARRLSPKDNLCDAIARAEALTKSMKGRKIAFSLAFKKSAYINIKQQYTDPVERDLMYHQVRDMNLSLSHTHSLTHSIFPAFPSFPASLPSLTFFVRFVRRL